MILRIRPDVVDGYKAALKTESITPEIFKNLVMLFQVLNYGDGTGYVINVSVDKRAR